MGTPDRRVGGVPVAPLKGHWWNAVVSVIYLIVVPVAILVLGAYIWHHNREVIRRQHAEVCAIVAYIEGQYAVTASKDAKTPPEVLKARREVIQMFEDRIDGNCS